VSLPHLESILDYDENENDCNSSLTSDNCTTGRTNTARAVIVMYAKVHNLLFLFAHFAPHTFTALLWSFPLLYSLCLHSSLYTCLSQVHRWLAVFSYHALRAFAQPCSSHSLCPAALFTFLTAHSSLHTCLSQVQQWFAVFSYHSLRAFAQPCSSHSLCPADMFNFPHAHSSLHTCLSQVQQWFAVPNLAR
jgi:hypothetical protein